MPAVRLIDDPDQLVGALSPLRRRILGALNTPASATELAGVLGLTRQKVNYHLRVLEELGLAELVEVRRRRGFTERLLRRTGDVVVDPAVLSAPRPVTDRVAQRDRHAAEHLVAVAGRTVREVTRMQAAAETAGRRLLTFTVEAEVAFATPQDVHAFTDELAAALAEITSRFHRPGGRRYTLTIGGHPAVADPEDSDERRPARPA